MPLINVLTIPCRDLGLDLRLLAGYARVEWKQ